MESLTKEIREQLRKPLPSEAVSQHPTKTYLSTIKAIYVVERLNDVFGIGGWQVKNEVISAGEKWIIIKATMTIPKYGIEIEQFGGNDNADPGDAYKGAATDALTKIGSYLEIGIDVFKGLSDHKPATAPTAAATTLAQPWKKWEKPVSAPSQESSKSWPQKIEGGTCPDCGGKYIKSKAGNIYCENKCWLPENAHKTYDYKADHAEDQFPDDEIVVESIPFN